MKNNKAIGCLSWIITIVLVYFVFLNPSSVEVISNQMNVPKEEAVIILEKLNENGITKWNHITHATNLDYRNLKCYAVSFGTGEDMQVYIADDSKLYELRLHGETVYKNE